MKSKQLLRLVSISCCALLLSACHHLARGTTFYASGNDYRSTPVEDKDKAIAELKKTGNPIIIGGVVEGAESVTVLEDSKREFHVLPILFGGIVGTRFYKLGDSSEVEGNSSPDKIRIINNMQIEANISGWWSFWNNYFAYISFAYNKYNIVYEVADVPSEKLYEHLTGIKPLPVVESQVRREYFRGIVFSANATEIVIKSPRTANADTGRTIIFLDRSGKQVATATVKSVFHTMVKTGPPNGKVAQGYSAVIYR